MPPLPPDTLRRLRTSLDSANASVLRKLLLLDIKPEEIAAAKRGDSIDTLAHIAITASLERVEDTAPELTEAEAREVAEAIVKQAIDELSEPDAHLRAEALWFLLNAVTPVTDREAFEAEVRKLAAQGEQDAMARGDRAIAARMAWQVAGDTRTAAIAAYVAGEPLAVIAARHNVSVSIIQVWVRKAGIQRRPVGRRPKAGAA